MIYMIFDISFSILSFFCCFFSIFTFLKRSFLGIFDFWLKTPPNCKSCSKNGRNHQFALLSFTFHKKKSTFWRWPFSSDLWHGIAHLNHPINQKTLQKKNNLRRSQFSKKRGGVVRRGMVMITDSMVFLTLP